MANVDAIKLGIEDAHRKFNHDFGTPGRVVQVQNEDTWRALTPRVDQKFLKGTSDPAAKDVVARDLIRTNGYYLIPPEPLGEVARVFQIGADKYAPRAWEEGIPWSDVVDRIFKHYGRWSRGEKFDLEDGQHNLASVAWAAMVLMEFEKTHPELDDIHG